jgi:ATP-binding cassette subfamily B (MDR/TAP) protein 1
MQVHEKYINLLAQPLKDGKKNALLNTQLYAVVQSVNYLVNGLVFWYGGRLLAYEGYTVKNFFTVFVAIVFGSQSVGRIFAYVPDISIAKQAAVNILSLLSLRPRIDAEDDKGKPADNIKGHVLFENVKFTYPTRPNSLVLKGLSFEAKPGQFIALVGSSGCGKSTTVGLLERFYEVTEGSITIDGIPLKDYQVASYRKIVGLVSQEPNLFDLSIRENITFGLDYTPTEYEIIEAAKAANIHSFISSLPEQYDTRVGIRGGQLSGGQKQRISIARALIKKPKILLLDEATSALDAESEKVVQEALDNAVRGRTTIAIAHRLSSIKTANTIYVFKDGVVHEKGNHEQLLAAKGLYYELATKQNL